MLSSAFTLFHAIDPSLSRLDPTLLSDQAKMEIAFERTTNKSRFLDEAGNYALITLRLFNAADNAFSGVLDFWPATQGRERIDLIFQGNYGQNTIEIYLDKHKVNFRSTF